MKCVGLQLPSCPAGRPVLAGDDGSCALPHLKGVGRGQATVGLRSWDRPLQLLFGPWGCLQVKEAPSGFGCRRLPPAGRRLKLLLGSTWREGPAGARWGPLAGGQPGRRAAVFLAPSLTSIRQSKHGCSWRVIPALLAGNQGPAWVALVTCLFKYGLGIKQNRL